jgi:hypothetical protein
VQILKKVGDYMDLEEYDELRRHIKDELGTLMENTPDKKCNGCIWFKHYPVTGYSAPERMPYAYCTQYDIRWVCSQTAKLVSRHIICLLDNGKEIE